MFSHQLRGDLLRSRSEGYMRQYLRQSLRRRLDRGGMRLLVSLQSVRGHLQLQRTRSSDTPHPDIIQSSDAYDSSDTMADRSYADLGCGVLLAVERSSLIYPPFGGGVKHQGTYRSTTRLLRSTPSWAYFPTAVSRYCIKRNEKRLSENDK